MHKSFVFHDSSVGDITGNLKIVFEKPWTIFLSKGFVFVLIVQIFSMIFKSLFKLVSKSFFKIFTFGVTILIFTLGLLGQPIFDTIVGSLKGILFDNLGIFNLKELTAKNLFLYITCFLISFALVMGLSKQKTKNVEEDRFSLNSIKPFRTPYYIKYFVLRSFPYLLLLSLIFVQWMNHRTNQYLLYYNNLVEENFQIHKDFLENEKKILIIIERILIEEIILPTNLESYYQRWNKENWIILRKRN